jgi:hypothetical protein
MISRFTDISDKLFFIVGTGRCGTTLLQAMLNRHPEIEIPPETRFFGGADPKSSFNDPLAESDIQPYLESRKSDWWWKELGISMEDFEQALNYNLRTSANIYLWLLNHLTPNRKDGTIVGEKTPYYGGMAPVLHQMFPMAKFIHLYRDPRDTIVSFRALEWWVAKSVVSCTMIIKGTLENLLDLPNKIGGNRVINIKYEDLVQHPESTLRKIFLFLDKGYVDTSLTFHLRKEKGYLNLESDWKKLSLSPLTTSRIGIHESGLTEKDIGFIEWKMEDLLERLGYKINGKFRNNAKSVFIRHRFRKVSGR